MAADLTRHASAPSPANLPPARPRIAWALLWRFTLFLALGVFVLGWLLLRFETHELYFPTPLRGESPAQWGLHTEEIRLASEDGETLHAWWIPHERDEAPALLFLHGNAGNREDRLPMLKGLHEVGLATLILDYRGYGGSSGTPAEPGLIRDGLAAYDWLAARRPGKPVVLFGESLGGGVAAQVALRRPAAGLILASTFTSVPELAERLFPVPGLRHIVRTQFDTRAALRTLKLPLLIIHGQRDEIVPFDMGETLFREAESPDKTFHAVRDGHHNDAYFVAGEDYWKWVRDFSNGIASNPH
jgi:hypothetical protein